MMKKFVDQINCYMFSARFLTLIFLLTLICCGSVKAQWTVGGNPTNDPGCNSDGDQYGILSSCTLNGHAYTPTYNYKLGFEWDAGVTYPAQQLQWAGDIHTVLKWVGAGTPAKYVTLLVFVGGDVACLADHLSNLDQSIDAGEADTPTLTYGWAGGYWYSSEIISGYHVVTCDTTGSSSTFTTPPIHFSVNGSGHVGVGYVAASADINALFQIIKPCSIEATSTGDVSVGPNAQYVSGTDCSVYGSFPVFPSGSGTYITSAKLMLNGVVVQSYTNTTGRPDPNVPDGLAVIFDSTHFCSPSLLNAVIMATDNQGTQYGGVLGEPTDGSPSFSVMVNNSSVVLANATADMGTSSFIMSQVEQNLLPTNHTPIVQSESDKAKAIYDLIPQQTVFFTHTHAGPGVFNDCLSGQDGWDPGHVDDGRVYDNQVAQHVALKGIFDPPYNFVHINGCNSSGTENIADTSLATAFGIGPRDTAYVGWLDEIELGLCGPWLQRLYGDLAAGDTLEDAIINSSNLGPPGVASYLDPVVGYYGDGQMQLTGVYLGNGGSQWYR